MAQTKVSLIKDNVIVVGHLHTNHGITTGHIGEGSNLYFTDARVMTSLGSVSTHIIPDTNIAYDLGSPTNRFRDLYLSSNTIHLGTDTKITVNNDGEVEFKDSSDAPKRLKVRELDFVDDQGRNKRFKIDATSGRLATFDAVGTLTADKLDLSAMSTTDLSEGSNLYYTDARVGTYLTTNSYATQSYVQSQVSDLVASAPSTLDTLNELAAALGDDPNFATTVSGQIGTKWTQDNAKIANWDTAYGWGNHASAGYLTTVGWNEVTGKPSTFTPSAHNHDDRYYTETESDARFQPIGSYLTSYTETSTLDSVADRGRSTNQQLISTNPAGFRVDSGSYARIELDSTDNWSYIRLQDQGVTTWDIACYNSGNLEWRPGGGETNRMTLSQSGYLTINGSMKVVGGVIDMNNNDGFVYDDGSNIMYVKLDGTNREIIHSANIGSQSVNYANSAGSSDSSGYSSSLYRYDNRTISPSEYGSGRMTFGFTSFNNNNTAPWADFIHLRGYTDNSGGNDNLLVFSKSSPAMRIYSQTYGSSTAYSNYVDVITSGNIGSQSVSYATNAGKLDNIDSGSFLRSDATDGYNSHNASNYVRFNVRDGSYIASAGDNSAFPLQIYAQNGTDAAIAFHIGGDYAGYFGLDSSTNDLYWGGWSVGSTTKYRMWHSGNDGSGSGLDADKLDGQQGSYYAVATHNHDGTYVKEGGTSFSGEYPVVVRTSADVVYSDANIRFRGSDSKLTVDGSVQAPIFYDNNNTGYYINPDGLSYINEIRTNEAQANPRWDTAFYVLQAQHWYGDNNTQTMYVGEDNYIHLRDNVEVTDDIRSPIYYDRDNTTYYTNPASTSNMNVVTSANDVVDDEVLFAVTDYDTTESLRLKFGGTAVTKIDDPDAPASGVFKVQGSFNPVMGPYMPMDDETEVIFECWAKHDSGSDTAGLFYAGSNFYDGNKSYYGNTQRYWGASSDAQDANDTGWRHIKGSFKGSTIRAALSDASYFRFIVLFNYQSNGNATRFCGFKFYRSKKTVSSLWVKRGVNDTGFQSTEASTAHQVISNNADVFPKSLLEMPAHSGVMKFRTNTHWESNPGIDFIGTSGEFRMSSDTGNLNLRVDGWVISHDDMRAPIFYDNNNTGYYLHPDGTSNLNEVVANRVECGYNHNVANSIGCSDWFRSSGNTGWYNGTYAGGIYMTDSTWVRTYNNKRLYTGSTSVSAIHTAGGVHATGNLRGDIFYDVNNTAYYCNPATQSNLVAVTLSGTTNTGYINCYHSGTYGYAMNMEFAGSSSSGLAIKNNRGSTGDGIAFIYGNAPQPPRGNISISSTGVSYNSVSDYRAKENVTPLTGAIDRVSLLKPSRFNFIGDEETVDGFLAHEVQEVVPQAVNGEKDAVDHEGNELYQSMDASKMVPLLTAALQEAIAKIESLESRIQVLENQ